MERIIIIGNGPSVLKDSRGGDIDKFDTIIRINDFQIKDFEQYVGTKTNIWATDTNVVWFGYLFPRMLEVKEVWLICSADVSNNKRAPWYTSDISHIIKYINHFNKNVAVASPNVASQVKQEIGAFPSTGLVTIVTALHQFEKVWIYGFDHFADGYDDYYSKQPARSHKGDKERQYVRKLIKKKRVEIL